jgi:hypothetical protein
MPRSALVFGPHFVVRRHGSVREVERKACPREKSATAPNRQPLAPDAFPTSESPLTCVVPSIGQM